MLRSEMSECSQARQLLLLLEGDVMGRGRKAVTWPVPRLHLGSLVR